MHTRSSPRYLMAKATPGGERDVAADDGVAAQEALLDVEEVHRAALALGAAGRLAEQFGHGGVCTDAPGERVAVIAVCRDHIIGVAQRADRAYGDRFLSAVLMKEAADLVPLLIHHLRPLLEAADQHHLAKPVQGLFPADDRLGGGLHLHHDHPTPEWMRDDKALIRKASATDASLVIGDGGSRSSGEQLSEHVGQNAAVFIVTHFLGGVDADGNRERERRSARGASGHHKLAAGAKTTRRSVRSRPAIEYSSSPVSPSSSAVSPGLNWSGRMPMPTRFDRWMRS